MQLAKEREFAVRMPDIMVVGGGKGGVGKTCFASNVAVEIAQKGWRVVLVDADLGCSNLETVLGIRPEKRLDDFFYQSGAKDLSSIVCQTQYPNLSFVPGTSGLLEVSNPRFQQKVALIRELQKLQADVVIIDLDAGSNFNTLDFFLLGELHGIVVITPEKTSIDNAFKFLRSALFRKIIRFYRSPDVARLLQRTVTLREFIRTVRDHGEFEDSVKQQICGEVMALAESFKPKIVVNRVQNTHEAQIAANILSKSTREYLMMDTEYIGHIMFDKIVPEAINSGVPFVMSHPREGITRNISDIANHLGYC